MENRQGVAQARTNKNTCLLIVVMDTDNRWQRVKAIFDSAQQRSPAERASYLDAACGDDLILRQEVESLLAAYDSNKEFLSRPAYEFVADMLAEDKPELKAGQAVGSYKILSTLGIGGMGEVYLAQDTRLGRRVALKLLPGLYTKNPERLRRFEQEARAASALNHPNILTVHEIGESEGQRFIATEFIEGQTLRERLRTGLDLEQALEIAIQVASALVAAHRVNIVHRDIKPENIMIRREDGLVKVLDFGLAKMSQASSVAGGNTVDKDAPTQFKTGPGVVMGTAAYMSPEQARSDEVDARTDIWSLGVVLYEMIAGTSPFIAATSNEIISAILAKAPAPPLACHVPDVPERLDEIVEKLLTKNKEERYQTSQDLLIDLRRLRQSLQIEASLERSKSADKATSFSGQAPRSAEALAVTMRSVSSAEYIVNQVKSHKRGVIVLMIVSVGLLAALSVYKYFNRGSSESRYGANSQKTGVRKLTSNSRATIAAISPDGKYVVHSQEDAGRQSLWLKQVATLSEVQIVPPAEVKYFGINFTPDGSYLYYVMGEKNGSTAVYQIPAVGGTPRKILQGIDDRPITLSPDGKRLAFVRLNQGQSASLWTANADGSGERELATRKRSEFDLEGGLAWSPDGRVIACSVGGVDAGGGYHTVVGIDVESGQQKSLTPRRWREGGQVAWRTDGGGLVLVADEQVWQLSYPGGEARKITNDANQYIGISLTADSGALVTVQYDVQSSIWVAPSRDLGSAHPVTSALYEGFRGLSWTPDGKIVYNSRASGNWDIWLMAADGTGRKQLTADLGCCLNQPSVSADGRYIVFASGRTGTVHIWRINIDGSDPQQLTNGPGEGWPECSPDGKWVVYVSYASGPPNLWKVPIEGGDPVPVTGMISDVPAISPDGKLIAFRSVDAAQQRKRISVISFEDGRLIKTFDIQPTTMMKGDYKVLRWTPDGGGLAYIDTRTGADNIWARPLDGSPERQLTDFKSEQIFRFAWSRDGKYLAVTRGAMMKDVILISGF
jgi:eukaryotic-like serine/threonine-protein kinase